MFALLRTSAKWFNYLILLRQQILNCILYFSELLVYHVSPPRNHWWKARYTGNWIFCGGYTWGQHERWDLLLRGGLNKMQSQITCWCVRRACCARPHWTNWSDVGDYVQKLLRTWLPWMKLQWLSYLGGLGDWLANMLLSLV